MCTPKPSAISEQPISSRKLSASTFTVGCASTNSLTGRAANIMIATAITTAATITDRSSAMPTAVITESSEKTMSSSMICVITAASVGATRALDMALFAFELVVDFARGLEQQEQAADDQDQVAAGDRPVEHA